MKVRPAGGLDALVLGSLHALAFESPWSAAELAALLATPGTFGLVAEADAEPAGFILGRVAADEAEVLTLATAPWRRRRGVGRALLDGAAETAASLGARVQFLEVASDNAAALALYQGEGFAVVGRRPGYYARPSGAVDAVVLRRALNR